LLCRLHFRVRGRAAAVRGRAPGSEACTGACGTGAASFGTGTGGVFFDDSRETVTIAVVENDSGADCSDDDVTSENSSAASSA
ncbi:MAG: hypothetical protein ABR508_03820, partial [Candidatus Baltobacteraceae bacterium]